MLRKSCCVVTMAIVVAVLAYASAQSPAASAIPHSVSTHRMATETAGALLALIDHILTPAMVSNLNDDGFLVVILAIVVAVLAYASTQSLTASEIPHSASTHRMATETAGALLALIDHILTPAMVSNLNDDGHGLLSLPKCSTGCHWVGNRYKGYCIKNNPDNGSSC